VQDLPWVSAAAAAVAAPPALVSSPPKTATLTRMSQSSGAGVWMPPKQLQSQLSPASAQLAELRNFSSELRTSTDGSQRGSQQ
jgi:hypothetical protein